MSRPGIGALAALVLLAGCSSVQSPVLYPNTRLQQVGPEQAEQDVAACRQMADQYLSSGGVAAKEVGKGAAIGAAGGAAVGAVAGAVTGRGAGTGAIIGAATGGTAGAVHGAARQVGPSPVYKGFVNRCLRDKGYEVVGWQ